MVQRSVGFEFQCRDWQFTKTTRKKNGAVEEEFDTGRGNAVHTGKGWHLESDGGEPEFVVYPPIDEQAKPPKPTMNEIAKFADTIAKSGSRNIPGFFPDNNKTLSIKPKGAPEDPVTADPQVTAGVRFDRLATFMSVLSQRDTTMKPNPSLTRGNELVQNRRVKHYKKDDLMVGALVPAVRDALRHTVTDRAFNDDIDAADVEREKVVGILALLSTYLKKAPVLGHALMKDMPLLSKSDFGSVIQASPLAAWFAVGPLRARIVASLPTGYAGDGDELAMVRSALMDVVTGAAHRRVDEHVYPPSAQDPDRGPTVGAWLGDLFTTAPVDRLSRRNTSFVDDSMGPLGRVDTVGPMGQRSYAPIVEMRRITEARPHTTWVTFMTDVLDWVKRLNDPGVEALDYNPGAGHG